MESIDNDILTSLKKRGRGCVKSMTHPLFCSVLFTKGTRVQLFLIYARLRSRKRAKNRRFREQCVYLGRENEQKIIDFASNVGTYVAKTSKIFLLEPIE